MRIPSVSVADDLDIRTLLLGALSDKTDDRETSIKGIDHSYYYEEGE
ncbi:MAG: hypothetical protein K6E42_00730 [Synergistes sp.]|nr:hypothetical protein [Synergistes sp.]